MSKATRNSVKLSLFTILSRIFGLIRDRYQAIFFGTGIVSTAWEIAFMLPNMLRNLLAEGVLSQAFIPVYADALKTSPAEARRVAGIILSWVSLGMSFIVLGGILSFPYLIPLWLQNQSAETVELTVSLSRVMFVFIATASLTAVLAGIANTHEHFSLPAFSPILLNLVFIVGFIYIGRQDWTPEVNASRLAWVVVLGGVLQLMLQFFYVVWNGWTPVPGMSIRHPALRKIFSLMAPAVLGASLFQINQLADIAIASYFIPEETGAIPALRYAHRLMQLPTGMIGVALSTTILPALAMAIRRGEEGESDELASALRFALFLTVPAAIGLLVLGEDILNLIYHGGLWNDESTNVTSTALFFYSLGVPAFSINKILVSSYYAYSDTRTPMIAMVTTVILNLTLNLSLVQSMAQGGIALSTSLSSMASIALLLYLLRYKKIQIDGRGLWNFLLRSVVPWLGLGLVLWVLRVFDPQIRDYALSLFPGVSADHAANVAAAGPVLLGVFGGGLTYLFLGRLVGLKEIGILMHYLPGRFRKVDRG